MIAAPGRAKARLGGVALPSGPLGPARVAKWIDFWRTRRKYQQAGLRGASRAIDPGAYKTRTGAVPDRGRGLGHMAPTYTLVGTTRDLASNGSGGSATFISLPPPLCVPQLCVPQLCVPQLCVPHCALPAITCARQLPIVRSLPIEWCDSHAQSVPRACRSRSAGAPQCSSAPVNPMPLGQLQRIDHTSMAAHSLLSRLFCEPALYQPAP
jgi:hypothetical protein